MTTFIKKNKKRLRNEQGHTLVELGVVLFILGLVAAAAIPMYGNSVEQSRRNEAFANLRVLQTGERVYALNNRGNFWDPADPPPVNGGPGSVGAVNPTLNTDITVRFYRVEFINANNAANPRTLLISLRRNTAQGGDNNTTFTIDEVGQIRQTRDAAGGTISVLINA